MEALSVGLFVHICRSIFVVVVVFRALWNAGLHLGLCSLSYSREYHWEAANFRRAPVYIDRSWNILRKSGRSSVGRAPVAPVEKWWPASGLAEDSQSQTAEPWLGTCNSSCSFPAPLLLPSGCPGPSSQPLLLLLLDSVSVYVSPHPLHPCPGTLRLFLIKFAHSLKKVILQYLELFRGQLLWNLIIHNKYSSGRWSSGDALGVITALPGLLGGYLKGFFPLNFVFFVYEMASRWCFYASRLVTNSN